MLDRKFQAQKSRVHSQPILEELSHFDNIRDSIANFIDHLRSNFHYSFDEMVNLQFLPIAKYVDAPIDLEKKS